MSESPLFNIFLKFFFLKFLCQNVRDCAFHLRDISLFMLPIFRNIKKNMCVNVINYPFVNDIFLFWLIFHNLASSLRLPDNVLCVTQIFKIYIHGETPKRKK